MNYLWVTPEYYPNKFTAVYDGYVSYNPYFFYKGKRLSLAEITRCYLYVRSLVPDFPDDPFIRVELRHNMYTAYVFTPEALFYFTGRGMLDPVEIDAESVCQLKTMLNITEGDQDKPPRELTDEELQIIASVKGCPVFKRTPILSLKKVTTSQIQKKYDCITQSGIGPLVNQKIIDILLSIAPEDVQFFDTELHCQDGILTNYKILNITHTIKGIDHEKSIYTKMKIADAILGFKYLTYKPGCMGNHQLARDEEYLSNILVTEEVKQAFEKEKVTGVRIVRPEDYYRPLTPADFVD